MKRFTAVVLALTLVLICSVCAVSAAAGGEFAPMSSPTIKSTSASSYTGDNTGEVDFDYMVTVTGTATEVGVSSIVIHKPDGSTETITGTKANGLVGSGLGHGGTYTYKGISGKYYYADVTLFATIGSTTDSRTITTKSAQAR